jgi:hypothetical protein
MTLVREVVETVILTGRLREHNPVSMLLIASPESGKTSIVLEKECTGIIALTDVTGRGLQELCKAHPDICHIVINDLVAVSAHKASVSRYTMSMLNAMTEEGIQATAFPGKLETYEHGRRGIIASIPTTMAHDGRQWWNKIGLSSRMLPFAFKHSEEMNLRIKTFITSNKAAMNSNHNAFPLPQVPLKVSISLAHAKAVQDIAEVISVKFQEEGYRRLKQFRAMACAHAVRRTWKHPTVTQKDVEFLREISPFISYTRTKELE